MKKIKAAKSIRKGDDELPSEIKFDYSRARPNRFAKSFKDSPLVVVVDPDIAKVYRTAESVNNALRSLLAPKPRRGAARQTG